jgi:hexosaminidase
MVLPRMPALAEVLWSPAGSKNWEQFNQRLQVLFKGYDQKGFNYSPGNFSVNIKPVSANGKLMVTLLSEALNSTIFYTTDGSLPTAQSLQYKQPIEVETSLTIKAVNVVNGKVMGLKPAEQSFAMHKAIGSNITYINAVNNSYQADGPNSLTDGVRGTYAAGKYWHGFKEKDLVSTIDMGVEKSILSISLGCLQSYRDWIFLPHSVSFETSVDGVNFTAIQTVINPVAVNETNATIHDFVASFTTQKARFIRVSAINLGVCPKGHSGEGQPAWLFADEIIVN